MIERPKEAGSYRLHESRKCHVWKTSGEFNFLISDGPDISWGHTFSWDDL